MTKAIDHVTEVYVSLIPTHLLPSIVLQAMQCQVVLWKMNSTRDLCVHDKM